MSRPASPASSVGSHISGISHPPNSCKRPHTSVLNGVSGDELLNRVNDWDDGPNRVSLKSPTSRRFLGLSEHFTRTPKEENNKATRVPEPPVLDEILPSSHVDHESNRDGDIEESKASDELDNSRKDYQAKLSAWRFRHILVVRQNSSQYKTIQEQAGEIRQQAREIRFLRKQRDDYRDMWRNYLVPRLPSHWDTEQQLLQAEQIRSLTAERDYYRGERDLYRSHIIRLGLLADLHLPEAPLESASLKDAEGQDKGSTDCTDSIPLDLSQGAQV
ncbi:hypothetical protein BO85DRAFT_520807 [Aspergillus piperis CBS 112811]|uniref:Uncharacterized protein n=1 Tax=Aspergillus piperis CBS 112811 TaxID=1448313 RepID=A0A8G1R1S6_9EURO|nr:hypothetical protein BO85DRAFT_520807 [Aspergillus piperis CBS 112811]RAH56684.1 hypothetical protein BO85DRAFT_520807 [Aspergillus piperis CBS 112811]